jgi:hypothetical protein
VTPSFGSYVAGCISLVAIAAALGFGAYHLRRWIVPEFSGALARLAELILAISLLVLTLQLLGSVSLLYGGWIVAASIAVGAGAGLLGRAKAPADADARAVKPPGIHWIALLIGVGVASFTVAEWTFHSQLGLDRGMFGGDTTWYHMPFAGRFAQEHSIVHLHFTDPLRLTAWFYPATYELLNGAGILVFDSDFLSPLMNLGWLSFGLLAAWCIGRPYGVAPATLVASALVFDSGVLVVTQSGEGRNDVMGIALLVAFAAIIVNGHQIRRARDPDAELDSGPLIDRGPLVIAGLAAGLAISVKLTFLAPVGAITLGLLLFANPRARRATLAVFGLALLATGAYWYGRNLIHSGSPLPLIQGFGPIDLPHPDQMDLYPRNPNSVAHYLFDPPVYRAWFFPRLEDALGPLWPLILVVALAGSAYGILRARNRMTRVLSAAALLTAVVYVFTPLTAAGQEGAPTGFFTNTRYLMPALVLALALIPIARPLRLDERRVQWTLGFFTLLYAATVLATPQWLPEYIAGTIFLTLLFVWAPAGLGWLRGEGRLSRGGVALGAAAVLLLAVLLGRAQEVQFEKHAYTDADLYLDEGGPVKAFAWAHGQHDQSIGIAGSGELFFAQYGFYGADLSNRVQYIGQPGPEGEYRVPSSCAQFRRLINEGDYDYLVVSQYGTDEAEGGPDDQTNFPLRAWVKRDPALQEIISEHEEPQPESVYRVRGPLHPDQCQGSGA